MSSRDEMDDQDGTAGNEMLAVKVCKLLTSEQDMKRSIWPITTHSLVLCNGPVVDSDRERRKIRLCATLLYKINLETAWKLLYIRLKKKPSTPLPRFSKLA